MLTDVEIHNYQSVRMAAIRLGRFTVITGPTGAGKSAIIRAIKLCAFNARGNAYISRGEKVCQVMVGSEPDWAIAISRHTTSGKDSYRVALEPPDPEQDLAPEVHTYTKLQGKVPGEVTATLGLSELNFAAQFDRPFLLSETAGDVARILGRLTNVTLLFEAAREAARRKGRLSEQLKSREAELGALVEARQRFATLPARRAKVAAAEEALARSQELAQQVTALSRGISGAEDCQARVEAARAALPQVPGTAALDKVMAKRARLAELVSLADAHERAVRSWAHTGDAAGETERGATRQLEELLEQAGRCPTCGQKIHPKGRT